MSMAFLNFLRKKFPTCTITLTKTRLYDVKIEMREAFRRWGPPRVGGDFKPNSFEPAPVTEQNPLVLPGMEDTGIAYLDRVDLHTLRHAAARHGAANRQPSIDEQLHWNSRRR